MPMYCSILYVDDGQIVQLGRYESEERALKATARTGFKLSDRVYLLDDSHVLTPLLEKLRKLMDTQIRHLGYDVQQVTLAIMKYDDARGK
jgi:hypothetical protein